METGRLEDIADADARAVARAAADWRRLGLDRPVPQATLERLYVVYAGDDGGGFAAGLAAAESAGLVKRVADGWCPRVESDAGPVPEIAMQLVIEQTTADEAVVVGSEVWTAENPTMAELAWRRAEELGSATGAYILGRLLDERGDADGAEAAYRRAVELDEPAAGSALGSLLADRGDEAGAYDSFSWADERGHALAAVNVGIAHANAGRLADAEAAWQRARVRGAPEGARYLGELLQRRGDTNGAEDAFADADAGGDAEAAVRLAEILVARGDFAGAEAACRRAKDRGHEHAAALLGAVLARHEEHAEAIEQLREGDRAGVSVATYNLGVLLARDGAFEEAEQTLRRALAAGVEAARGSLASVLLRLGRLDEAEELARQAHAHDATPESAHRLGVVLERRGATPEALDLYRTLGRCEHGVVDLGALATALCLSRNGDDAEAALADAISADLLVWRERAIKQVRASAPRTLPALSAHPCVAGIVTGRHDLLEDDAASFLALGIRLSHRPDLRAARRAYEIALASPMKEAGTEALARLAGMAPDNGFIRIVERIARHWPWVERTLLANEPMTMPIKAPAVLDATAVPDDEIGYVYVKPPDDDTTSP
jgi:tetratricopeptide (TPR) repeat protein